MNIRSDLKRLARRELPPMGEAAKLLGTSRPTAYPWLLAPQDLKSIRIDILVKLLTNVYGLTIDEVSDPHLGDIFDLPEA